MGPNRILTLPRFRGKLGKIYFTSKSNAAVLQRLEDARFSTVDFRWYCDNGELHPAYEQYKQNHFQYQFTLQNTDKDGREVEFTGKFGLCFPLQGMPPIQLTHLENAEAVCNSWSLSVGLVSERHEKRMSRFKNSHCGYIGTAMAPGLTVEQRKLMLMFMCTLCVFDDWVLDMGSPSFAKLHLITNTMASVLRGEKRWNEDQEDKIQNGLRPFLCALQEVRQEALKYVTEQEASYFIEALCEQLHSYGVEICSEWKDLQSTDLALFRHAQPSLRNLTVGINSLLETIAVSSGIVLDKSVRQCFLFKHFGRLCVQQTSTVNDVLSFQKEMKSKETCNHAILLHVVDGLPLEEAMERTVDEINALTEQIVRLGEIMVNVFADKPEVASYVDAAKQMVQGHYFYYPFAPRYGLDITFDCVVESDY